jgi:uncharacterized protein
VVRVGLISDTHSTLHQRVCDILIAEDVKFILHAGDICKAEILYELEAIAPVTAVLGNNDYELPGFELPLKARIKIEDVQFLIVHDFLHLDEIPEDVDVVVCGHTHRPRNEWHGSTLVVNPGSASQRRSQAHRSLAILDIPEDGNVPVFRLIHLEVE